MSFSNSWHCALFTACSCLLFTGCQTDADSSDHFHGQASARTIAPMHAAYAVTAPVIDGTLDDAVWQQADKYSLTAPANAQLGESGTAQLAWDENNLYVAIAYSDTDLYATGTADQEMHFTLGDVAEIFLKPDNNTYYWELYATPKGHKTSLFLPGERILFGDFKNQPQIPDMRVAASVEGSINHWQDRDTQWCAEFAIPRDSIEKFGAKFAPEESWHILIARYNYNRFFKGGVEYSTFPALSAIDFHLLAEYAPLVLDK